MLQRVLSAGAVLVVALSVVSGMFLAVWGVSGLATISMVEAADPHNPVTVQRGKEVIALIQSGALRPPFDADWDVSGHDEHPGLTWSYEAVIWLPKEYRDLSFGGTVDASYFPGDGELTVTFYQDGGLFGPNRDHFLLYDDSNVGDWWPGPGGAQLADEWWYVADADWMLDPVLWEQYGGEP